MSFEPAPRLFGDTSAAELTSSHGRSLLYSRLLEDGDGGDLRALTGAVSEVEIASWFESLGGRKLSTRSQAFWSIVFGRPAGGAISGARELWSL